MLRFIYFSVIVFIFISCQDTKKSNLIEDGDMLNIDITDTCSCDELDIDSLNNHLMNGESYTGVCIANYPNTNAKYIEKNILEGKLHGNIIYFDKEGNILIEEIYENGIKKRSGKGDAIICDCSELVLMRASDLSSPNRYSLDEIPFTGICKSYYPKVNQVYVESNYKHGFLNGYTMYYEKDGTKIFMEKYVMGRLESTIY